MALKKLPQEIFYLAPNGLLAYENTSPDGYEGETEIIFAQYSSKGLNLQDKKDLLNHLKSLKDRKSWETFLSSVEGKVEFRVKEDGTDIVNITWSYNNTTKKDIMRIRTQASSYNFVAELVHSVIEISAIKKK